MADIKPTGNFGQINYPSADQTGDAKPNRNFSVVQGPPGSSTTESVSSPVEGPKFSKADLQDPAKLDQLVRSSALEIVNSQTGSSPLSSAQKQHLSDYMSEDPIFRQRIETYLRKALP
jgi:hypothetical protein